MHEIRLQTIDSTQTYAKAHAAEFPKDQMTCVSAEEQTAGRGRYNRIWVSPKGVNLYVTFYFRWPITTKDLTSLAQVMACSFAELLLKEGLYPLIKWPNDVQLSGKKVSGILSETAFQGDEVDLFLGIGINVNMGIDLLSKIDQPATSLQIETGKTWDRWDTLKKLQMQFSHDLELFKQKGFAPFHPLFEKLLAYRGQTIHCFDGKKEWVGICHSLSADGQLNILLPDQTLHKCISGDILLTS
ncbi:MAG TPA: biotin--[acetyl-CoA-carboxylase] ligase [Chlamydiales bacterium]|jgi:BirA family biotin operon repressor/biotin-[acetyl-CoA-carboxylase] ligase|nr:biotin--[acetyl-CoA-carboxylase] ligase [Chlamydiales bacterium]